MNGRSFTDIQIERTTPRANIWKASSPNYGSVAEWLGRKTWNLEDPGSSTALTANWTELFHRRTEFNCSSTLLHNFLMASRCIWLIKMQGLWEAELSIVGKPKWFLTTLPSPVLAFWLASLKGSLQRIVEKMSQRCQKPIKLSRVATVKRAWLLRQ